MAHRAHKHHALGGAPSEEAFTGEVVLVADPTFPRGLSLGEVEFRLKPHEGKVISLGQQMLDPGIARLGRANHDDLKGFDARQRRGVPRVRRGSGRMITGSVRF